MTDRGTNVAIHLQALWALHLTGGLSDPHLSLLLQTNSNPFVRGWTIQLALDGGEPSAVGDALVRLAEMDSSPVVRRYLASAVQRVPENFAWPLIEALAQHGEDKDDRNIPYLLWHGMATRWSHHGFGDCSQRMTQSLHAGVASSMCRRPRHSRFSAHR